MTREIKFRAWDRANKRMMDNVSTGTIHIFDYARTGKGRTSEEKDCDFMQYTGLKDKNGVEIYEGDIIKSFTWPKNDNIGTVEYFTRHAQFIVETPTKAGSILFKDHVEENFEVIGNIYENPELVKELV